MVKRLSLILILLSFMTLLFFSLLFAQDDDGYEYLIHKDKKGVYNKHGWNHYGPGYFTLNKETGELKSHGGMGLFWYAAKKFKDFVLELDYKTQLQKSNSGIFLRIPECVSSNDYTGKCFEVQICDTEKDAIHRTGALYDAKAPIAQASKGPGVWNHYKITCKGNHITVELNGVLVNEWDMQVPAGKIKEMYPEGYIGLQNHDQDNYIMFRNVKVKELD